MQAHLDWIETARRRAVVAAQERVAEARSAADRHEAAIASHQRVTAEVQEACAEWVDYLGADDVRETPSTRSDELTALASEIEATRALADVLPLAEHQVAIAAGVCQALQVMLPLRRGGVRIKIRPLI